MSAGSAGEAGSGNRRSPARARRGSKSRRHGSPVARCSRLARALKTARSCWPDSATIVTLVSVAIVLIGLAGGILVTRRMLEPIHRLIAAVSAITRTGSTDTRVPVGTDRDAIDELSALFNQMLDRISTLIEGMGSALDNVAHDLRTPMTRLRGVAERALASDPAEATSRHSARRSSTCLEESERILAMLDTLMDISEAETGTMRLALAPVDLDALVREVVSVYEDVAEDKQIDLRTALMARCGAERHRRSRSPAPGAGQPGRQRHQVHAVGRTGDGQRSCRRGFRFASRSPTPASGSQRTICRGSGSGSIAATTAGPNAAWASASASSAPSSGPTAARSTSAPSSAVARPSPSACQKPPRTSNGSEPPEP